MHPDHNRREPTLSETPHSIHDPGPAYQGLDLETEPRMHPLAKLALLAVIVACLIFCADRAWQRYREYRMLQEAQALIDGFEQTARKMGDQEKARIEQQRRDRAASRNGRWLNQNCADWRRAYKDNPVPTARREMQRHCQVYERYLASGVVPARSR